MNHKCQTYKMSASKLVFDPEKQFKKAEIEHFIIASGAKDEFDRIEADIKKAYLSQHGLNVNRQNRYETLKNTANRSVKEEEEYNALKTQVNQLVRGKDYSNMLKEERLRFINRLRQEGRLVEPEVVRGLDGKIITSAGKSVTKKNVEDFLASVAQSHNEREKIVHWVSSKHPSEFNINALEHIAKYFKIPISGQNGIEGSGEEKKANIYNRILGRDGYSGKKSNFKSLNEVSSIVGSLGLRNYSDLIAQTKDTLAQIAKDVGIAHTGSKQKIADNIASLLNWSILPSKLDLQTRLRQLREQYPNVEELKRAIMRDNVISADALDLHFNADDVKSLFDELKFNVTAKNKKERIRAITDKESSISSARANKVVEVRDLQSCLSLPPDALDATLKNYKCQSRGLTHNEKCKLAAGKESLKRAEKILVRFNVQGENKKMDSLSKALGMTITNEAQLLPVLANNLYVGKAYVHAPEVSDDVQAFISNGALPSSHKVYHMARVFSDIAPGIMNMGSINDVTNALKRARQEYIEPLLRSDLNRFTQVKNVYGFSISGKNEIRDERPMQNVSATSNFGRSTVNVGAMKPLLTNGYNNTYTRPTSNRFRNSQFSLRA